MPNEDLLNHARIEFEEEVGRRLEGEWISLGALEQRGGKTVHAWAFAGDLPPGFLPRSNLFEMEWPPRSGQRASFPEIDRAEVFPEAIARVKINPAQAPFLDRLRAAVK